MMIIDQYINVSCEEYSLLVNIDWIEEVVDAIKEEINGDKLLWRGENLQYMDLTSVLIGHAAKINRHCLILKNNDAENSFLAVGVGEVSNIEVIKDEEFEELPAMDFPFNDYFDRAYIEKRTNRCIYRLRNLAQ